MSDESPQDPPPAPRASEPSTDRQAAKGDAPSPRAPKGTLPSGLFQRILRARRALTVVRGYAFIGAILAAGLFAASYVVHETELPRWICRLGAMGALLSAVVSLNAVDRLVQGRSLPATSVAIGLALIAAALLGVGVGSIRYELGGGWSPLVSATYVVVGVRILLRFRSTPSEASR